MEALAFILLVIAFMAAIFFTWYFVHRSKEKERLLLLERGMDPSELPEMKVFNFNFPWLKVGCVITGIAIGLFLGVILEDLGMPDVTPLVTLLLGGGIGMIIAHYLDEPKKQEKETV